MLGRSLLQSCACLCLLLLMASVVLTASAEQKTFRDALEREVKIDFPPKRLVSLSPGVTEMLFDLGLDKRVVGVTRYCNYPPKAQQRTQVGGYYDPSLEKIVALQPDLVLMNADGHNEPTTNKLTEMGIPCYVANPRNAVDIVRTMESMAAVTGISVKAASHLDKQRQRLKAVEQTVAEIPASDRLGVFYGLGARDLWTTGKGTLIHDLIERAGGLNIAAKDRENWYQFSPENLVLADPDFVLTGRSTREKPEDIIEEWQLRSSVPAVAAHRIITVDNDSLSRPGPRAIDVLEEIVFHLYGIELRHEAQP